ncbi:hypothetical protein H4219_004854 [Mycoemilia scoparia]|uniref:BON domain-containing protein n=1 Tax=Mycoemilia scoparia TaxID=417184 RepID=A0A9W7ZVX7_9FUNG|nr:hypothetical protein H4219_004854 [Mycoemilia scoparia]
MLHSVTTVLLATTFFNLLLVSSSPMPMEKRADGLASVTANAFIKVGNLATVNAKDIEVKALYPDHLAMVTGSIHADVLNKAVEADIPLSIDIRNGGVPFPPPPPPPFGYPF